jgi:membrane-associated phospholipid phosphatase
MLIVTVVAWVYPLKQHQRMVQVQSAASAVFLSIGISELLTQMIKAFVGRLRPNFYEFCGFDLITRMCMASPSHVNEARQSFPSGHSSLAFQGMVIIILCLVARIGLFALPNSAKDKDYCIKLLRTKQLQTISAIVIPLFYGIFVATSRLVDYWHHPSDVLAGILIGIASACLAYHLFYPAVFSKHAGIPYACFALYV